MKALSLTQPWATAIVLGSKRIETRSWPTKYRGPLAIHASKGYKVGELIWVGCSWTWCGALWKAGWRMGDKRQLSDVLPFGGIIGVATLTDCRPTDAFTVGELEAKRYPEDGLGLEYLPLFAWTERQMGDFAPGRYGFVLTDVVALPEPIPCKGALGLWTVPADVLAKLPARPAAPLPAPARPVVSPPGSYPRPAPRARSG